MKRYNTALSVRMDEHEQGEYVKAEVSQALYDALKGLIDDLEGLYISLGESESESIELHADFAAADKALSLADGETE